jgi:ATP-dependent DNA ligase
MASKSLTIRDFQKELPGEIDPTDNTIYQFPMVISKSSGGKNIYWRIIVRLVIKGATEATDTFLPIIEAYFDSRNQLPGGAVGFIKVLSKIGDEGKIKKASNTYVTVGKNVGKVNATNPFTQALRDALSKYNKQSQKTTEINTEAGGKVLYPPMLANVLDRTKLDMYFSDTEESGGAIFTQPKLNGVRTVATLSSDGKSVIMYSRTRKLYPGFVYIKQELLDVLLYFRDQLGLDVYLDGEAYKHGVPLQTISGVARRELEESKSVAEKLEYHIYDLFVPDDLDMPFDDRNSLVASMFDRSRSLVYTKQVETECVDNPSFIDIYYKQCLAKKYEGAMMRLNKPYKFSYNDYHSSWLLKIKPVMDAEFKIIGYTAGTIGKSLDALMFKLATDGGAEFTINLGMPLEDRIALYKKMPMVEANGKTHFENNYLGKKLVVLFDEYSEDGIPVRARTDGIVIRDYE